MKRIFSGSPYEEKIAYARAVVAGGFVHVSGTTGLPPEGPAGDVAAQCKLTLDRIRAALQEAGASLSDVVRVTYILPDIGEFEACWPVLRDAFGQTPPAATAFQAGLINPDMKIEIEVTALAPSS